MFNTCVLICPEIMNMDDADSADLAQLESVKQQCPNINIPKWIEVVLTQQKGRRQVIAMRSLPKREDLKQ
jgi:hypothetical protein